MMDNDFVRKFSVLRVPLVTQVEVTRRCNFRCSFCYLGESVNIDLNKELLIKSIEEINSMGGMKILFTGGEPFLYEPLLEVTRIAKKMGFICEINTNGYFLDKYDYVELSNLFASINISVHSDVAEEHDKIVGVKGAWKKTIDSIIELKKNNANVFINTVLVEQQSDRFLQMKQFFEEELNCVWVPDINISPNYSNSYDAVNKYTVQIDSLKKIVDEKANRKLILGEDGGQVCTGECKAARNLSFIDSQGYIYPCLSFKIAEDEIMKGKLGNIANLSFGEIWNENIFLREVDAVTKKRFLECLECDLYKSCHKCIAENYLNSGDFYTPSKTYCSRQHVLCSE